jgi:hypothetical protein
LPVPAWCGRLLRVVAPWPGCGAQECVLPCCRPGRGAFVGNGVGDAAYHGKPLLVPGTTWTTRLPANAALFDVAPPPAGKRGRPALKGARLGKLAALAAGAVWEKTTVYRYGRTETVYLARLRCIWYGSFGNAAGWCVLVREPGSTRPCDLALFTFDAAATAAQVVERYAVRWPVEPACHPFGMLIQSMVTVWYTLHGHHPDDVLARRLAEPWYQTKTEPSFEDMITKLRKTLIVARFSPVRTGQVDPDLLHDYALACAAAAA